MFYSKKKPSLGRLWTLLEGNVVEAAGIEPASVSPPLRGLHAYSVFNLANGYPTGREGH